MASSSLCLFLRIGEYITLVCENNITNSANAYLRKSWPLQQHNRNDAVAAINRFRLSRGVIRLISSGHAALIPAALARRGDGGGRSV